MSMRSMSGSAGFATGFYLGQLLTPAFAEELLDLAQRYNAMVWLIRMGSVWQPLLMPRSWERRLDA